MNWHKIKIPDENSMSWEFYELGFYELGFYELGIYEMGTNQIIGDFFYNLYLLKFKKDYA